MHYLGTGISGGETGARHGPAIMPGGDERAYARLEPILTQIAAQVDDGPCVTHVGRRSAGHYVKMVHNGIEYGDMQLIAEAYSYLAAAGYGPDELADIFAAWNESALESYLIQITADIFKVRDAAGDGFLVDAFLDQAGQKGTGRWTSRDALDLGHADPHHRRRRMVAPHLGPQGRTRRGGAGAPTRRRAADRTVRLDWSNACGRRSTRPRCAPTPRACPCCAPRPRPTATS